MSVSFFPCQLYSFYYPFASMFHFLRQIGHVVQSSFKIKTDGLPHQPFIYVALHSLYNLIIGFYFHFAFVGKPFFFSNFLYVFFFPAGTLTVIFFDTPLNAPAPTEVRLFVLMVIFFNFLAP